MQERVPPAQPCNTGPLEYWDLQANPGILGVAAEGSPLHATSRNSRHSRDRPSPNPCTFENRLIQHGRAPAEWHRRTRTRLMLILTPSFKKVLIRPTRWCPAPVLTRFSAVYSDDPGDPSCCSWLMLPQFLKP